MEKIKSTAPYEVRKRGLEVNIFKTMEDFDKDPLLWYDALFDCIGLISKKLNISSVSLQGREYCMRVAKGSIQNGRAMGIQFDTAAME